MILTSDQRAGGHGGVGHDIGIFSEMHGQVVRLYASRYKKAGSNPGAASSFSRVRVRVRVRVRIGGCPVHTIELMSSIMS